MPPEIIAALAAFMGVVISRLIDVHLARRKQKPAELALTAKRWENLDQSLLQQRQQFDEATAKFRGELQQQIDTLQRQYSTLLEENNKLRLENITLTLKVAQLEFQMQRDAKGTPA